MKKLFSASYAIISYGIGFISLVYWIASTGNLWPEISIDGTPKISTGMALLKNFGLVLLFGLQHTVMARKGFKAWITRFVPTHLERSTYVLATGIVVILMVWQWEPLGGVIWHFESGSFIYYSLYVLHFSGWGLLFVSTFLINHFDLFGLRQVYLNITNKPYTAVNFKVVWLYKLVRHPLYLGALIGIWATPHMTATHLIFATLLTAYIKIGVFYEEEDLMEEHGDQYKEYQKNTPKLIPIKIKK